MGLIEPVRKSVGKITPKGILDGKSVAFPYSIENDPAFASGKPEDSPLIREVERSISAGSSEYISNVQNALIAEIIVRDKNPGFSAEKLFLQLGGKYQLLKNCFIIPYHIENSIFARMAISPMHVADESLAGLNLLNMVEMEFGTKIITRIRDYSYDFNAIFQGHFPSELKFKDGWVC